MRAVVQRVKGAAVAVEGEEVARIGGGLLIFLGVAVGDGPEAASHLARKIAGMRIFADGSGRMNLPVRETGGEILVVPQFTLLADCRRGNRPSFSGAAPPEAGERLYREFVGEVARWADVRVKEGVFGAHMDVSIVNDGPVTFVLDSPE